MVEARCARKMKGKSAAEAVETEAESQHKQTGSKSVKTRAQKDAHNTRCVQYRLNNKRRREELEQVETKYYEMVPKFEQMQTENQGMKMELKQNKSKIRCMENSIQELKRTLEKQVANEARMRQIPIGWKVNGQNFSSFNESVEWFASQTNVQDGQVSGTSGTVLQDAKEIVGLGATGTDNFSPYTADFWQQMGFDLDYTNIAASAAGPSSVANHDLPLLFDASNNHGVGIKSAAGSSCGPNHDLPVFNAPNNHDNLFTNDIAARVLTNSAAGSSFGANHDLPIVFDATNNHENNSELFTRGPAAGFQHSENPSSDAFWRWPL